jgi:polysaccharide biosynthesis/export protein
MGLKSFGAAVLSILMIGLVACAPNRVVDPVPYTEMDQQAKQTNYGQMDYLINPGDTLDIKFMHYPELNEAAIPVRPDGKISLQMAPEIMAAGRTPVQLRDALAEQYSKEILRPEIVVIVRIASFAKVYVDGEVVYPQLVELKGGPVTVMSAINLARGAKETARLSNVIVIRKDFNGKPAGTMVDLRKVIDGTDFSQNINLMPYDIVYVPKSNIARIDSFVTQYINQAIPFAAFMPFLYYYGSTNNNN